MAYILNAGIIQTPQRSENQTGSMRPKNYRLIAVTSCVVRIFEEEIATVLLQTENLDFK